MKSKKARFAELKTFSNVFEYTDFPEDKPFPLKDKWAKEFFKNNHPLTLELACGKGEYTVELARKFPERNYIGVDIKGNRIWKGAKISLEEDLKNTAFLRASIERLEEYFGKQEVEEIWLTFPDPFEKKNRQKKRFTSPRFLAMYKRLMKKGGLIHLKTDNLLLYEYSIEILREKKAVIHHSTNNLYDSLLDDEILSIRTYYEEMFLKEGKDIKYICFSL